MTEFFVDEGNLCMLWNYGFVCRFEYVDLIIFIVVDVGIMIVALACASG